jgi:hypothetical protein
VGWPVQKCLVRVGVPAATMAFGFAVAEVVRGKSTVGEAIGSNLLLFGALWLAIAAFLWLLTRGLPRTP